MQAHNDSFSFRMHKCYPAQYEDILNEAQTLIQAFKTLKNELNKIGPDIENFDNTLHAIDHAIVEEPEINRLCPGNFSSVFLNSLFLEEFEEIFIRQ